MDEQQQTIGELDGMKLKSITKESLDSVELMKLMSPSRMAWALWMSSSWSSSMSLMGKS